MAATQRIASARSPALTIRHAVAGAPHRAEAEAFIAEVFRRSYDAEVTAFAPNLMVIESPIGIASAVGWRGAGDDKLFLETYLDRPIEHEIGVLAGHAVRRELIAEVGNLAADHPGSSVDVIIHLASHLDALGFEWVTFTATRQLIRIFQRLGLPPLALAPADPRRLGDDAARWGRYYESEPIVVAGRIRLALDRMPSHG